MDPFDHGNAQNTGLNRTGPLSGPEGFESMSLMKEKALIGFPSSNVSDRCRTSALPAATLCTATASANGRDVRPFLKISSHSSSKCFYIKPI